LLELSVQRLIEAGYVHIGIDHFALPHDELARALGDGSLQRNFQGYSTRQECDLIGLGLSAIGSVGTAYTQNAKLLGAYYHAIDEGRLAIERGIARTVDDLARGDIIQSIMCRGTADRQTIETRYAVDFRSDYAAELVELRRMMADGLLSEVEPII